MLMPIRYLPERRLSKIVERSGMDAGPNNS